MTRFSARLIVLSWTVFAAASVPLPAVSSSQGPETAQAQLLVRQRTNGDDSLLLGLDTPSPFDEVRLELPVSWTFKPGQLPPNWSLSQDDKRLTARGQPLTSARMRFDTTPSGRDSLATKLAQKKVVVELFVNGKRAIHAEMTVTVMDNVTVAASLDGALVVPRQVTAGERILMSAGGPYAKGSWEMSTGGRIVPLSKVSSATLGAADLSGNIPSKNFFLDEVPAIAPADGPIRFRFTDEWGDPAIDAPATDMRIVSGQAPSCNPRITGNTPRAFAGQAVCVSGCFPQQSWTGLTVDGQQSTYPLAASMTTIRLSISDKTDPGPHEIRWSTLFDGGGGTAHFRVLGLLGSIDQNLLWRGQSTTMRLQLVGTDEQLPLQIFNRTPAIIAVEGGTSQTVTSSGGPTNALQRSVRGIRRGDFAIDYQLVDDSCGLSGSMRK